MASKNRESEDIASVTESDFNLHSKCTLFTNISTGVPWFQFLQKLSN